MATARLLNVRIHIVRQNVYTLLINKLIKQQCDNVFMFTQNKTKLDAIIKQAFLKGVTLRVVANGDNKNI